MASSTGSGAKARGARTTSPGSTAGKKRRPTGARRATVSRAASRKTGTRSKAAVAQEPSRSTGSKAAKPKAKTRPATPDKGRASRAGKKKGAHPGGSRRTAARLTQTRRAGKDQVAVLKRRITRLTSLLDVAKAMTAERDLDSLLDLILDEAVAVISADRCTLWIVDHERRELWTKVAQGLGKDEKIRIPVGVGIAGQVAQTGQIINIPDAYADARFNRQVDRDTGYRTRNILAVPMRSTSGEVTGVLQALNKIGTASFNDEDEEILLALGANAAAAIENAILYEEIDRLFEGFVKASVIAIESRDPTTSGHSERVAILTTGIAEEIDRIDSGPYGWLHFSPDDMREIRYAALLHDFGKVGVRENVLVKAMKLYPGELETIETRFTALRAQREAYYLRAMLEAARGQRDVPADLEASMARELEELQEVLAFIRKCNMPTVLESGGFEKLREIGKLEFVHGDATHPVVTEREVQCLSIPRGSLNAEERLEIESHVTHTFRFLAQIPWTRTLRRVPEIAYAHHEKLDGAGYPRQLQADQIPVQSRMMTIADIYDALTASDRPYKKAVPHEKALDILHQEAKMNRLDKDLLAVFVEAKVHERLPPARHA